MAKINNQKLELAARKMAIFRAQVQQTQSNAAGIHGGTKRDQNRKRRQDGRREAREF